jgi:MarR family transcriptional regulator, transcriptional regulator for hemolysin
MPRPAHMPVGLRLARTARSVSRAFDEALTEAGGSLPVWLVLISLKSQQLGNQRELADAVGITAATLTHHLNTMDDQGLVTRRRDPENRRVHRVELTEQGEVIFRQLSSAANAFNQRLRRGISDEDIANFEDMLGRLEHNATSDASTPRSQTGSN